MGQTDLITAQALADALNLSVETIWRYTRNNKIPYVTLGERQYRYNLQEVLAALTGARVREKAPEYISGPKKFTYQDYLELPEEPGYRYEVLAGELVKEPSPIVVHQRICRELEFILLLYFRKTDPLGEIFFAPLDVTLGDFTVVQPDILFISGTQKDIVKETRIDGAPRLVVEIISETSRRKDRLRKRQIYQEAGVQHYWLVDSYEKTFECLALRDGEYILAASGMDEDTVTHPDFPGLSLPLAELWQD
ncbi:MAG: Uma2 family endonuclease [Bacillota bacterium]|jgi:excisionase family DNA binding protein|nr:DNA-binding protein [Bacillota bacterium]